MSDSFSMRMSSDDGLAPPAEIFAAKPDRKGPKTVAVLLVLGSIIVLFIGYGYWELSSVDDLVEEDIMVIIEAPNNQGANITVEEYQEFHDIAIENGAYHWIGFSLLLGGGFSLIGGIVLFNMNPLGSKLAGGGALISLFGGIRGIFLTKEAASESIPYLVQNYELMAYLCGTCMFLCGALAALPLLNAGARAALYPKVTLTLEEE